MKNKKNRVLGILIALLLVVGAVGTYALYNKTFEGIKGTAEVAKWSVALKQGETDLSETKKVTFTADESETVKDNKVAPGRGATATIKLDATGTEVLVDYIVSVTGDNLPTGATITATPANGQLGFDENQDIVLKLTWPESANGTDTEFGEAASNITVDVTVTATQATAKAGN